jgi:small-conductance mechanosensitive channel
MTEPFSKWTQIVGTRSLRLLAIVLIAVVLSRLLRAFTARLVDMAKSQTRIAQMREQQTRTMAGLLFSTGTVVIVFAAILAALPEFGFNIAPIAAIAGLASLALGFGGQYLVRDLISGFFVVFEDQYVVGDRVRIGEETGRVEHISLRRTVLRNDRGALVTIPNGLIGQVANLSRDWSQTWVDVVVPSDEAVSRALAALERIATELRSDPEWSAALVDGPRVLGVESLSLSGTTVRVAIRSAPMRQDDVARELRRRIKAGFEKEQIPLSIVQRVELVGREGRME